MEQILSLERISIKIGTSVVATLYFFMIYMPQRDQVEKRRNLIPNVNQFLTVIFILQAFCFARLVLSERCRRLRNIRYGKASTTDEHDWPIFNRIRFWTFVQQEVKFGVSFLASP